MIDFLMPESDRDKGENPIVDSLAVASENTIVSKCALHGLIYVWDLKSTLEAGAKSMPKNAEKVDFFNSRLMFENQKNLGERGCEIRGRF
jgi:hypothetical protein